MGYIGNIKYKVHQNFEGALSRVVADMFGSLYESLKCNKVTGRLLYEM